MHTPITTTITPSFYAASEKRRDKNWGWRQRCYAPESRDLKTRRTARQTPTTPPSPENTPFTRKRNTPPHPTLLHPPTPVGPARQTHRTLFLVPTDTLRRGVRQQKVEGFLLPRLMRGNKPPLYVNEPLNRREPGSFSRKKRLHPAPEIGHLTCIIPFVASVSIGTN